MKSKRNAIVLRSASGKTSPKRRGIKETTSHVDKRTNMSLDGWILASLTIACILLIILAELLIKSHLSLSFLTDNLGKVITLSKYRLRGHNAPSPSPSETSTSVIEDTKHTMESLGILDRFRREADPDGGSDAVVVPEPEPIKPIDEWTTVVYPDEKYIKLIPGRKTGLRQDRRVDLNESDFVFTPFKRDPGPPTDIRGRSRGLVAAENVLKNHPLRLLFYDPVAPSLFTSLFASKSSSAAMRGMNLEDTMIYLKNSPQCMNKPIFLTMATVGDDLYWQLIENFMYSMVKFEVSECSLIICVKDSRCMEMCAQSYFPCYNYQEDSNSSSVMEMIAGVKLLHIPKALLRGVDVFMLDLDVGFLQDPMHMVRAFYATPRVDIFVQEDYLFIMNRSRAGWKTWYTEPLPNIGLFLVRGNNKTSRVFSMAWDKYQKMPNLEDKKNPGKDQNHVLEAMRFGRVKFGLRFAYFSNSTAILMDKMVLHHNRNIELGGAAAAALLEPIRSIAMHTTCYEKSTKVMGLKAANAFWSPKYYDPQRRTITKQLLYMSENQLLDEVRALVWLAMRTDRAVIVPNILGSDDIESIIPYQDHRFWPGFRVVYFKRVDGKNVLRVDILEPAFYWRVERDYDPVPEPQVIVFHPATQSLEDIRQKLETTPFKDSPRIVLHGSSRRDPVLDNVLRWSNDSVGWFEHSFEVEGKQYGRLPSVKQIRTLLGVEDALLGMRTCDRIFQPRLGNRTCFQICE